MNEGFLPTLDQFQATCREALSFLAAHGFREVQPPSHRAADHFQVWFVAGERVVLVRGESWGAAASITLEHSSGVELPIIYLVPQDARPKRQRKRNKQNTQLEQIRREAGWLKQYGEDFLRGDLQSFLERATPLPPHLRPPEAAQS